MMTMIHWTISCMTTEPGLGCDTWQFAYFPLHISLYRSNIQEQVKQQATAPTKPASQLPEIVSGQFDDDLEFEESVSKSSATGTAGASKGGVTAEDLDELDGALFNRCLLRCPDDKSDTAHFGH